MPRRPTTALVDQVEKSTIGFHTVAIIIMGRATKQAAISGMAMPMILFPNVLVNSVSVLLMPAISEAYARKDFHLIRRTIKKTVFYCLLLGFSCTFGFLLTGKWIGQFIFQNT